MTNDVILAQGLLDDMDPDLDPDPDPYLDHDNLLVGVDHSHAPGRLSGIVDGTLIHINHTLAHVHIQDHDRRADETVGMDVDMDVGRGRVVIAIDPMIIVEEGVGMMVQVAAEVEAEVVEVDQGMNPPSEVLVDLVEARDSLKFGALRWSLKRKPSGKRSRLLLRKTKRSLTLDYREHWQQRPTRQPTGHC